MKFFLAISSAIDSLNTTVGRLVTWLTLFVSVISAGNAIVRKLFNYSSNAWLELQWYMFGAIFLLAAGYTFLLNEHVRVDVISQHFSKRTQVIIEIIGLVFFLFPAFGLIFYLSIPFFYQSLILDEQSSNAGGLVRWPVKLLIPAGFGLLLLAGISHLIKCIGFLRGQCPDPTALAHGQSSEEELAEEIRRQADDLVQEQLPADAQPVDNTQTQTSNRGQ